MENKALLTRKETGKLISFAKSKVAEGKVVITVSQETVDEITGITTEFKFHYIVVPTYYYKNLVGKEVEITLVNSEKLAAALGKEKYEVVTKISLVKTEEPKVTADEFNEILDSLLNE